MSLVAFDQASLGDCTCDECEGVGRFADGCDFGAVESVSISETGGPVRGAAR